MILQIGSAGAADEVFALLERVYGPFEVSFTPNALRWTPDLIRSAPDAWICAWSEGQLIGTVRHELEPSTYTFDALAVDVNERRRGIGTALLAAVESKAVTTSATRIRIALRRSLRSNICFFTSRGYRREEAFSDVHDVYQKNLGGLR